MKNNIISINSHKMNYHLSGDGSTGNLLKLLEDNFQSGKKNIAVSSTHYHSLQQNFIMLALNYFNQKYSNKKIGVVSFSYDSGHLQEFYVHSTATKQEGIYNYSDYFDLISWNYLLLNKVEKSISSSYDFLVWELPEIENLANSTEKLGDSLENIDAIFIISNRLNADSDDDFVRRIGQYFLNHGVNITNLLSLRGDQKKNGPTKIFNMVSDLFKKAS